MMGEIIRKCSLLGLVILILYMLNLVQNGNAAVILSSEEMNKLKGDGNDWRCPPGDNNWCALCCIFTTPGGSTYRNPNIIPNSWKQCEFTGNPNHNCTNSSTFVCRFAFGDTIDENGCNRDTTSIACQESYPKCP